MENGSDDVYLIWLGDMPSKRTANDVRTELQKANTLTDILPTDKEFKKFQDAHPNEMIFIILNEASKSIAATTKQCLKNMPQVQHLWILIEKPNLDKKGAADTIEEGKITKVMLFDNKLILEVKHMVYKLTRQNVSFSSFDNAQQKTTRDLTRNAAAFLWFQMLLRVLKDMNAVDRGHEEMIERCITYYKVSNREKELQEVEDYRQRYKKQDALMWYTRDCFLYRLVNKALRTEDVQWLYTFRGFIIDVCDAIQYLKDERLSTSGAETMTLYRGQYITKREFGQIKTKKIKLISTNGFFSTTTDRSVAIDFLKRAPSTSDVLPLLFEITASTSLKKVNFADISRWSAYPEEKENIFALSAVFNIDSIENSELFPKLQVVKMTATDDGSSVLQKYEDLCAYDVEESEHDVIFGRLLIDMGQFKESKVYFECLLTVTKKSIDEDDVICAPFFHNMGRAHGCLGEFNEAFTLMTRALKIRRSHKKLNDPDIARTLNSIGVIEGERGNYATAMSTFQEALEIFMQELQYNKDDRKANLQVAVTKTNIGWIMYLQGNYDQSRVNHEEALNTRKHFLTEKHPLIADTLTALGALDHAKGEYEKATKQYEEALAIRTATLPRDHPAVANSHQALGGIQLENGQYLTAVTHYEKALGILKSSLSHDHILIAGCEKSIGSVYLEKGDYDQALTQFENALNMSLRTLSSNHPIVGECYHCIGMVYERQGNYGKTSENYNKALERIQAALPIDHPSVAKVLSSIATLHLRKGELIQAEQYLTQSFNSQKKIYGDKPHPDLVLSLNNQGILFTHKGAYAQAERFFREALLMCEQCFSKNHLAISRTRFNLGELYIRSKKYSEAAEQLEKALEIRKSTLLTDDLSIADIHTSLGYASFSQRKYPEAKLHYIKSHSIYSKKEYRVDDAVLKRVTTNLALIESALQQAQDAATNS